MLPRTLEPEVMDSVNEAEDYDAMDHSQVNRIFVEDLLTTWRQLNPAADRPVQVLDVGTGTALIPLELCRWTVDWFVTAIDLSSEMLRLAERNIARQGSANRVRLVCVDSKSLGFVEGEFDVVMSNSIVHHIPDPADCLWEMWRVLKPGGLLFVRDLYRPTTSEEIERLVATYAGQDSPHQQQLFRQSFHAALTVEEMRAYCSGSGIPHARCEMTSDRHWTLSAWK